MSEILQQLVNGISLCAIYALIALGIPSIDHNNWGSGVSPFSPYQNTTNFLVNYPGAATFSPPPPGALEPFNVMTTWVDSSGVFSCSGYSGSERVNPIGSGIQAAQTILWTDSCSHYKEWAGFKPANEEDAQMQYDSLRIYIQICALSDNTSWQYFNTISAADQFRSNDSTRFDSCRTWLVSVLYLNTIEPEYFCACMGSIQSTYQYGKYKEIGGFAVVKYLREHHPECWGTTDEQNYQKNIQWLLGHGYDTSKVPPLDSIGLAKILQHDAKNSAPSPITVSSIDEFALQPNPAQDFVTATYLINRQAIITMSVFDILGKEVWSNSGSTESFGEHSISIDLHNLPAGTYYVRLRTIGEVKTVKLVHEK